MVQQRQVYSKWGPLWAYLVFFMGWLLTSCNTPVATTTTDLSPTPTPTSTIGPFHATTQTFDKLFTLTLDVTPNLAGSNMFVASVVDNGTHRATTAVHITFYTTMLDMAMGTDSVELQLNPQGKYSATSNLLSMGGHWAIAIAVETPDHTIHKAGVTLSLPS